MIAREYLDVKRFEVENSGVTTSDTRPTETELHDDVDSVLNIWKRELPDLDLATEGIVERIQKIAWRINRVMDETLAAHDLNKGEWRLLGALRRHGPPYRRSPGQLADEMGLSSGAMTNRLDRMESAGLIRRQRDPNDRRAIEVELTDAGWQAWQTTTDTQAAKEALIASALDATEKEELNRLLRRLLVSLERSGGPHPKHHEDVED
jgi:DNA-binding MarR family transcriptional regulator